jgi:hypothetical protein
VKISVHNILCGDRVSVIERENESIVCSEGSHQAPSDFELAKCFSNRVRRFNGEVVHIREGGLFDVLFDDGTQEVCINRWRVSLLKHNISAIQFDNNLPRTVRLRMLLKQTLQQKQRTVVERRFASPVSATKYPLPLTTQTAAGQGEASTCSQKNDKAFLFQNESFNTTCPRQTIQVGDEWTLVYVGRDTQYALTNVIPTSVRTSEPHTRAAVQVCVQTLGVDYPHYERSLLSSPATFFTQCMGSDQRLAPKNVLGKSVEQRSSELKDEEAPLISRARRDLVRALVHGQTILLEKRAHVTLSEGVGDDYL